MKLAAFCLLWAFAFCKLGNASSDLEISELGVELISHFGPALELQFSPNELSRWNASADETGFACIEDMINIKLYQGSQCSVSESKGDAVIDADGSGWEDDSEGSRFTPETLSKTFCNDACHGVFMSAYEKCGYFEGDTGKRVKDFLGGVCTAAQKEEVCLEVLTRFEPDSQLERCMSEGGCPGICKSLAEDAALKLQCCVRKDISASSLAQLFTECGVEGKQDCKEKFTEDLIANSATGTGINAVVYIIFITIGFLYF